MAWGPECKQGRKQPLPLKKLWQSLTWKDNWEEVLINKKTQKRIFESSPNKIYETQAEIQKSKHKRFGIDVEISEV